MRRMGEGGSAFGPRSWMLSEELVLGFASRISASFPDGVWEGGEVGSSLGNHRTAGWTSVRQGHYFLFFSLILPSPLSCPKETPRWPSWRGGTKTASWSARASCHSGSSTARVEKTKLGTTRWTRGCGATPAAGRWEARSRGVVLRAARPTPTLRLLGCPGDAVSWVKAAEFSCESYMALPVQKKEEKGGQNPQRVTGQGLCSRSVCAGCLHVCGNLSEGAEILSPLPSKSHV